MMTDKYTQGAKIKKREFESHVEFEGEGYRCVTYSQRFSQNATKVAIDVSKRINNKVRNMVMACRHIHGSVMATKPKTMQDAIEFAIELMDKKINTWAEHQANNKRKSDDTVWNNQNQQPNKRQNTGRAYAAGNGDRRPYEGPRPLCSKCNYHHEGPCVARPPNATSATDWSRCISRGLSQNWKNNNNRVIDYLEMRKGLGIEGVLPVMQMPGANPDNNVRHGGKDQKAAVFPCSRVFNEGMSRILSKYHRNQRQRQVKGKRLEVLPVVQNFLRVNFYLTEDLPGIPPTRQDWSFEIDLVPVLDQPVAQDSSKFSKIAKSKTKITQKGVKFDWGDKQEAAYTVKAEAMQCTNPALLEGRPQTEAQKPENIKKEDVGGMLVENSKDPCRSPVYWAEVGQVQLTSPELVQETTERIIQVKQRIQTAHDRQKSYADLKRKPMEFQVGDKVMLKVSPWKGVRAVAYKLELPQELSRVHNTFHGSNLKKCYSDDPLVVPLEGLQVDDKLHFVKEHEKRDVVCVRLALLQPWSEASRSLARSSYPLILTLKGSDTEEEDVSSTNTCDLNLGGMEKRKERVKGQVKEENEMETDMEVDEVIEEESKFETDEEVEEILEEEEDDGDGENFNLFPTMKELTHHEWLLKNHRPPWVKARIRAGSPNNIKISCMIPLALSITTLEKWFLEGPSLMKLALSTMKRKEQSFSNKLYLMRRSLEVLRKFHWMILGGRFNQLSHVSSPLLSKPGEY
ncbi:hypothetical protein Tco_0715245 [Tanacetum coccineum]